MSLKRKDLVSLASLSADEILHILETADSFKEVTGREIKKVPALRDKTVVNLFFEPSTRTRTSFELAAKRLSADVINFSPSSSSVVKGETLLDTARNIEAMQADVIVVRHPSAGAADSGEVGLGQQVPNHLGGLARVHQVVDDEPTLAVAGHVLQHLDAPLAALVVAGDAPGSDVADSPCIRGVLTLAV